MNERVDEMREKYPTPELMIDATLDRLENLDDKADQFFTRLIIMVELFGNRNNKKEAKKMVDLLRSRYHGTELTSKRR